MMKNMTKRLAVFLSILLMLPAILSALPMTAMEVSAGDTHVSIYDTFYTTPVKVEAGTTFSYGDYITVYSYKNDKYSYSVGSDAKIKYKSSDSSIAEVNGKGIFTAKKAGKATITGSYKGAKITRDFEVVEAGTLVKSAAAKALQEKALAIKNMAVTKVNAKNAYECLSAVSAYKKVVNKNTKTINSSGFSLKKSPYGTYYGSTGELVVPEAAAYVALSNRLSWYGDSINPTSTRSSKVLKLKSASAATKAITLKFAKKVSAEQILGAKINDYNYDSASLSSKNKAYARVAIYDPQEKRTLYGKMELKKGSKTAKITSFEGYSDAKRKYVKVSLKKGRTYRLGYNNKDWAKWKSVKVK